MAPIPEAVPSEVRCQLARLPNRPNLSRHTRRTTRPTSPQWFDRETGQPVPDRDLKTYRQALAQYHLHPEDKFLNGDYTDRGPTHRRHVEVIGVHQVGNEANRLDQQLHLGYDSNAQLEYGVEPKASNQVLREVGEAVEIYGVSGLARDAGLSRQYVSSIVNGRVRPSPGHSIN